MNSLFAPLARVILRYGVGFLAGIGLVSEDMSSQIQGDADVLVILIAVLIASNEAFWWLARRKGWAT